MHMLFHKKQRTPLGFCDGLDNIFVGFGSKDERGCRPPKYHASYAPYYPIHKAASMGDVDAVKSFIERGAFAMEQADWKYRSALHFACVYGHPEVVTLLVESSCEISPKDAKDATPLIKASQCRQMECLDILLKHGADPNIVDCSGNTALHYAVYNGDIETATKLLEYKANIEAINENKITPLLLALKQNKEKMAEFLINNGANAKTCDFLGRSSLMYAVRCGSELIIKLLLQRDIDTFKQDVFGWTAKRYAVESKSKVRKLLIDYDEEKPRQRCSEITKKDACIMPILPTTKVKDSPQSEAVEKSEARPSKSESTSKDTCTTPILPTMEMKDSPQSEAVEKAEARPSKSESTETDACSTPTTKMEDFPQNVAAEEAEANPPQSEPGLGMSSEEKAKTADHDENDWSLNSHNSEDEEENSKDITQEKVLAWDEKDDSSKPKYPIQPTTMEKKSSSDDVEIIVLKPFNSDLSAEVVIEVSSEEEQKGEDNDGDDGDNEEGGDDEDGDDEDGDDEHGGADKDGTRHPSHVEEETQQPAGERNQDNPSNKPSIFQEDEDSSEHSEEVAAGQPLGKDEEPKSQRDEDSDETTEEEETKEPLGQDKTSIPQTVEDSAEDSEEEAKQQPVEERNQERHCQRTNNDKNFSQIFEDSSMDSEEEAAEQPMEKSNPWSLYKKSILQKLEDSSDDSESIFEWLPKKGIDHLHGAADQSGDKHIKEPSKKYPLFKPTIEMNDSVPKNALGMAEVQTLTSANSDLELTSSKNEISHSDSTINSPLTVFNYIPRKEENGYLTGSAHLQGQNTAIGQMKEPAADMTLREEEEIDDDSDYTQAFNISETYGLKKILGYLQRIPNQRTQNLVTGGMAEVKEMTSREEQSLGVSSVSNHSWTFSDLLLQKVDVSPLIRSRDQTGENMAREESKGNKVTPIEKLRRHDSSASVESLSSQSMSERPPEEQDVGHLPDTAALRRENTRNGGMKVFSDFSKESPPQLKPTVKRKSSFLNRAVAKRQERSWESAEPDNELTSTEEQRSQAISERSESLHAATDCTQQKEVVEHLTGAEDQRRENQTRHTMGAVCKEVTTTEEKRIHDSPKSFQSLVIPQPHPMNEAIICLTGTPGQERENEVDMEMKGSPKEYPPQFKESTIQRGSVFEYTAVVDMHASTSESEESGNEETSVKKITRHGSHQSIQSWTTSETFSLDNVVHLARTTDERPENITNAEVKAVPDKEIISTRGHDNHGNVHSLTTSETSTDMADVHFSVTTDQILENTANAETKDLCKEATLTEERRRHDSPGSVQTLIVCEPFPRQKNGSHLALTTDHRIESEETTGMKAKPDGGVMTPTKEQRRQKSVEKLGTLAISECLPQRSIIDHLAASENMTNSEKEVTVKEMASTEEPRRNNDNEKVPPWIASALPSTREHLGHLADTMHQRRENNTSLEMNEPEEVVRLQEEQRKHDSHEIQSLIVSEHLPQKHDAIGLAVTMDQRRQNKTTTEMSGPCNEETSTEDEGNCNSHESVQSLVISEPLAQEDVVHLLKIADQRGENVANGQMKEKTSFYVTSRDQNRENGSENSQPSLKQKRKTGLSTTMDTVEKLSFGNTAAAHGGGGGDGDNASATSETGNGFIQQMNCGKARDHQFPVEQKKHVGLNKKTSGEKNKALMYVAAMDDQLSESFSEDYDLPDYDNILMIVNQLQMKYKDSGKPLEIQETVRSYKMLIECNQSHSELLIKKSKKKRNQGSKVMKKPRKTEKAKQLKCKKEEQELDLIDVGSPEKQEVQKRNAGGCSEKEKKQLAEEEQQYKREKQQLELHLRAQDTELRHLRNDIIKLQEAQHPETKVEHGDNMAKEHLQKIEHEVFKLVETVKKQTETIEQLERKLPSEDKTLTETGHRTQAGQEFLNTFREMYTTSVMSQLELRIQHLEREFSEIKTRTHENVMVLENYVKVHQSHKLMETEAKLKEVTTQFVMLIQHNTALLNLLSSIIVSECPCMTNFHRRLESLFTQENTVTPTSGPQPSNQSITAHLDTPTNDMDDFNKALTKSVLSAQSELHQKKKKCLESAKEKILSKNCFKPTKTSTVCENGEHSFSEVSNTRQFEKNIPVDEQQHEIEKTLARTDDAFSNDIQLEQTEKIVREDQEMFDNIPGNHNALFISPREFKCTNLESEHSKETTHQALCKAEPEHYKDPCLGWVAMTSSSSQGQLRSKDRQDGSMMRRNFNKMEAYTPASNMCMMSSDSGFGSGQLYNSLGYSRNVLQREPLMTSSRPQPFENSLSFLNKVREENQQTSYDKIGNHNASFIKPQKSTLSNLQSKHPEEVIHQASCKAEPRYYEEPYPERIEMTKPLPYDQLQTKDRQDESLRRNFDKMKAYSSKPNLCTTTNPAPGFGSGQLYNSLEHSGSLTQREAMMPSSRPYHFVESLDSYLCRTWQQLHNHC
ncbi:uncharacterized protein LOC117703140 isoform X2 [Arvicanthis niloticus]|uniref:uncharacterized protein LOC117703140 isoform X1 n=1 Tax=Arvicanthis niloticus TaxID=61156 RepID=UPI00402B5C28